MFRSIPGTLIALSLLVGGPLWSQGVNVEFGQNRVQYHDFDWQYYESENFVTYFYLGGQDLGKFATQAAEQDLPEIEAMLDYKITSRMEILVYTDVTDLNQSNIGVGLKLSNTGGVTKIIGNKIFIYFNGDHLDLRRQLREGIAQVLINHMMFGGNVQEVLQNAVLLNLPEWFVNGLVAYIGDGWNAEVDSRLRDGILSERFKKFNKLQGDDARLAGRAFWYYVAENYGTEAIPNLLYLTRINRSLENGFIFVLGYPYRLAIEEWYKYFKRRYESESIIGFVPEEDQLVNFKPRNEWEYSRLRTSPNSKFIAYAGHRLGEWKVWLHNVEEGSTRVVAKGGFKTKVFGKDKGYPLLSFDASGRMLVVIYEKRDVPKLMTYDLRTRATDVRDMVNFQRIRDVQFKDNRTLLLSGINRGQSDIYTYNIRTRRTQQVTNDFYDDIMPGWVDFGTRRGIVFASNRTKDTLDRVRLDSVLPIGSYDLFFFNELREDDEVLTNLTNTPHLSELHPMQIDRKHFAYLSEANGIYNRHAGYVDSIFARWDSTIYYRDSTVVNPVGDWDSLLLANEELIDSTAILEIFKDTAYVFAVSNLSYGIIEQSIDTLSDHTLDLMMLDGKHRFVKTPLPETISEDYSPTLINTEYRKNAINDAVGMETEPEPEPTDNTDPVFFQTGFEMDSTRTAREGSDDDRIRLGRIKSYHVKFSTDYVLSQLDNSLILTPYESFVGNGPVFQTPDLSGLITLSISDLFEDYRITGGFRIPTSFTGSEYFITYENLRKRIDKKLLAYHKVDRAAYDASPIWFEPIQAKRKTHYLEASAKYPFDILRSVRAKLGYRKYRVVFLSTDAFSNVITPYQEDWLSGRAEYVFDNTYEVSLNILNGTRYKVYAETQKGFTFQLEDSVNVQFNNGFLTVLGFDARHYQKVHRQIIWANRVAGATSFGTNKLIYYLGGVDNWLFPQFNEDIEVNLNNDYAFQTLATNMRGFTQNIRNGNSFLVFNSELRIPVFSYLVNAPIRSELLRNFQIVGFGDIGTAWEGKSPFADDNPVNSDIITKGPVKALVKYFRNPVVAGYGIGARSVLFGYFVRLDLAWGLDSGTVQEPLWYISFSTDF